MSVLNPASEDEAQECPLCLEFLELDDISFYPCSCEYQICRFCWNKIRTEGNNLCPACRSPYAENPADFKPLTAEELAKIKAEKRQKDAAKKAKISENRKHLANVRVVQRNLVFVVGLSPRLADQDMLRKPEYFGKFGKIHKVVINHSTSYAGSQSQQQGPSASAYVTYYKSDDALRAIQAVNNIFIDGRTLKASLGTTKYCSHFMKNQSCPKHDCMYLHELGDEAASFTKEEMQQGKHTDYERALHDMLSANGGEDAGGGSSAATSETPAASTSSTATAASSSAVVGSSRTAAQVTSGLPAPPDEVLSSQDESDPPLQPPQPSTSANNRKNKQDKKNNSNNNNNHNVVEEQKQSKKERDRSPREQQQQSKKKESWPNLSPSKSSESFSERNGDVETSENGRNKQSSPAYQQMNEDANDRDLSQDSPRDSSPLENLNNRHQQEQKAVLEQQQRPEIAAPVIPQRRREPAFFDEDEDLGFDPFAETQKGLAEMLESETQMVQQQRQQHLQQQQQHRQNHHSGHGSASPGLRSGGVESNGLPFGFQQHLLGGGGGSSGGSNTQRMKAPPPGFSNSMSNNVPPQNLSRFSNGFGRFCALQPQHHPNQHLNTGGNGSGFGGLDFGFSNHNVDQKRMNGGGLGGWQQQQSNQQHGNGKDWQQDSFRALLPNINVSFGNLPSNGGNGGQQQQQQQQGNSSRLPVFARRGGAGSPLRNESRGWNGLGGGNGGGVGGGGGNNDLTMLDPAIVGGSLSNQQTPLPQMSHHLGQRPESPSSWIKTNLEQLTTSSSNADNHHGGFKGLGGHGGPPPMLSGFAGMSLSSNASNGGGGSSRLPVSNSGWGASSSAGGAAPPPGFALNPAALAALQQSSGQQQQHQLPPFGGNNDGPNGGKSDFFPLA